jgi:hypothetical protein
MHDYLKQLFSFLGGIYSLFKGYSKKAEERRIKMIKIIEHSKNGGVHTYIEYLGHIYRNTDSHFDDVEIGDAELTDLLEYLKFNESTYELFRTDMVGQPKESEFYSLADLKSNLKSVQEEIEKLELSLNNKEDYSDKRIKSLKRKVSYLKKK